jgi:RNA-directed DNA polymerase
MRTVPNANGVLTPTLVDGTLQQLAGKFAHVNRVDKHNAEIEEKAERKKGEAKTALRAKEGLYRRFLMFKEFYSADAPVVICEGKTDNVYLSQAVRRLAPLYPQLALVSPNGEVKLTIRILRTAGSTIGRVLRLGGGASDLGGLIDQYLPELQRFKALGKQHAVMLLLDNDDAADPVYASIRKLTNNKSASRNVPFVHVAGNLYAVITPLKLGKTKTIIEDCFADEIKNLSLGGKTFNPSNKADPSKYFSKHILSQYVRQNAGKIDFSGFVNLLDRIVAAILHHQGFKAGSLVADVSDAATTQP